MRAVGLKTLKNKLSEYVRVASSGKTVLVTDRNRVVAEIGPPREGKIPLISDARLADVMRRGWLSAPLTASGEPTPRLPVAPLADILRELDADRAER